MSGGPSHDSEITARGGEPPVTIDEASLISDPHEILRRYNSPLVRMSQAEIESLIASGPPKTRIYGRLPHFQDYSEHLLGLSDDLRHMSLLGILPDEKELGILTEALFTYRLKFGESLFTLPPEILSEHPPLDFDGVNSGEIISLLGLSGSGKSFVTQILEGHSRLFKGRVAHDDVTYVFLDTDTVRLNTFAAPLREIECDNGTMTLAELPDFIYDSRMHQAFHILMRALAAELALSNYTVVVTGSTSVIYSSRHVLIQHPKLPYEDVRALQFPPDFEHQLHLHGQNEVLPGYEELAKSLQELCKASRARMEHHEPFDWEKAPQILPLGQMKRIVNDSPSFAAHGLILKGYAERLAQLERDEPERLFVIPNPMAPNLEEAGENLVAALIASGAFPGLRWAQEP